MAVSSPTSLPCCFSCRFAADCGVYCECVLCVCQPYTQRSSFAVSSFVAAKATIPLSPYFINNSSKQYIVLNRFKLLVQSDVLLFVEIKCTKKYTRCHRNESEMNVVAFGSTCYVAQFI